MSYVVRFEIGRKKYPRKKTVYDDGWYISDEIDNELQDLCMRIAELLADDEHPMLDEDAFTDAFYDKVDVGGLRDAVILAAKDVMDCEVEWIV